MATYLYGLLLADKATRARSAPGVVGAAVRVLDCGELTAIVSTVGEKVKPTLETVRAHDAALQCFVDAGATVAAVRFGQQFDSDLDCRAHVMERAARLVTLLHEYDGAVEMRVLLPGENLTAALDAKSTADSEATARASSSPGRAYLEALRSRSEAVTNVRLREALGPVVLAEKVERLPNARGYVFAHLVKRADEREYRDALAALPALGDASIVGPLALYGFAEPAS